MADAASMAAPPGPPIKERAPRARPIPTEAALAAAAARADAAACAVSACAKDNDAALALDLAATNASSASISAALPLATLYSACAKAREDKAASLSATAFLFTDVAAISAD